MQFLVHKQKMYIQLFYKVTIHSTGETKCMSPKVDLLETSCNYGGHRYWFECPDCHRRSGILYIRIEVKCRKCLRLTYKSQKAGYWYRLMGSRGYQYILAEERESMRITHYKGKPTKRYLSYLKRFNKSSAALEMAMPLLWTRE